MPSTFTSLLLFALLLIPGMAYVTVRERETPTEDRSAFRDTVRAITAGLSADLAALGILVIAAWLFPGFALDIDALLANAPSYLRQDFTLIVVWCLLLIGAATALAMTAAALINKLVSPSPATMSSWWYMFEGEPKSLKRQHNAEFIPQVLLILDDGSRAEGTVDNFNMASTETNDRDIILGKPLKLTKPDGKPEATDSHFVCVSASRIQRMSVYYRVDDSSSSPPAEETGSDVSDD